MSLVIGMGLAISIMLAVPKITMIIIMMSITLLKVKRERIVIVEREIVAEAKVLKLCEKMEISMIAMVISTVVVVEIKNQLVT